MTVILRFFFCFLFFFKFIYFERERAEGAEREGEKERITSRLCTVRVEPDAGLELPNRGIMT